MPPLPPPLGVGDGLGAGLGAGDGLGEGAGVPLGAVVMVAPELKNVWFKTAMMPPIEIKMNIAMMPHVRRAPACFLLSGLFDVQMMSTTIHTKKKSGNHRMNEVMSLVASPTMDANVMMYYCTPVES